MDESTEKKESPESEADKKLMSEAKERFKRAQDALFENHARFSEDVLFYDGEGQWDVDTQRQRELEGRPCITVNRQKSFVRQVTNDALQNPISCKVRAVDDGADPETAEIFTGLIRHIESNSNAEIAYSNAFFYSVVGGMGYYRIVTDYVTPTSFNQDIFIRPIPNSLSVFFDPDSRLPDGSDWKWCFIVDEMDRKEFDRKYPKSPDDDFDADSLMDTDDWYNNDNVRVAEYFYIDYKKDKVLLFDDGLELLKSEYDDMTAQERKAMPKIMDERDTHIPTVKWCLLGGHKILDKKDFPGRYIPVLPIFGDIVEAKGRVKYCGLIRPGKDSQRMLNYYRSTETELLALQPKAPFIAAEGQIEGFEDEWANANNVSYSVLPYKPTSIAGVPVPPPQRQQFSSPPTGVLQGAANATQDMMDIYGIHEASLGEKSNETSGKAIVARASQSDNSTFNFIHAKQVSISHCARILVDIIPKVIDTKRVVRILGEDGSEKMTTVNAEFVDRKENGDPIKRIYDLDVGIYDVVVSTGASYSTRREEAAATMALLLQTSPQLMQTHGDLIAKSMDWPGAEEFAKRSEKMLPPGLKTPKEGEEPQLPPQVQEQMDQMDQTIQGMTQEMQKISSELENKQQEVMIDQEKVRIDQFKAETDRMKVLADIQMKQQPQQQADPYQELDQIANQNQVELQKHAMTLESQRKMKLMELRAGQTDELSEVDDMGETKPNQLAEAIGALLENQNFVSQQLDQLIQVATISAMPKEIVKDENGRPIGIRPVGSIQ